MNEKLGKHVKWIKENNLQYKAILSLLEDDLDIDGDIDEWLLVLQVMILKIRGVG